MNENNLYKLNDAFRKMLTTYGLQDTVIEQHIKQSWRNVVGEYCHAATKKIRLSGQILFVTLNNAALKQEMSYYKQEIIAKLNEVLKEELVKEIRFN